MPLRVRNVSRLDVLGDIFGAFWVPGRPLGVPERLPGTLGGLGRNVIDLTGGGSTGSKIYFWKTLPELDPWRAFWASQATFILLGREFVYGIDWNGLFRNWATSRRWGVGIELCYFFVVFRSLLFAKQWGEYVAKTNCVFNDSDIGISGFQWKYDADNVISGTELWGPGRSVLR